MNRQHNRPPPRPFFLSPLAETPRCGEYPECTTCAEDENCAWCASEGACMTVSEIFSMDCRGTVFDLPCPTSFIAGEGSRRTVQIFLDAHRSSLQHTGMVTDPVSSSWRNDKSLEIGRFRVAMTPPPSTPASYDTPLFSIWRMRSSGCYYLHQ